jgi:class 3 adenylate cyclase/tetratricopeptide (TPR) repeat protein
MRCPRCSADNLAGMKFCGQCGAPLGGPCPSCGSDNPPEHRFCGQCGVPLDRPGLQEAVARGPFIPKPSAAPGIALPGEMKQVTVLFCDIVGSTPLTERLGAEAMRDLVSSFLATSLAEVHRYGGAAPQFTGDGFMALFGAPVTQEDHVQRALLAALAIQRALGETEDTSGADKLDLPVRIGIHSGPVVFGPVADGFPMDYTAIGDTANVAARIQQAAEPATILLSEATYELAQTYTRVEPVGPLVLKGKADPITAYRLLEISQAGAALRPSTAARRTAFVDRQSDLAVLNNFLRQVESGHRQAVGILGEPGIGKSRLLSEFQRQLASERVTWIEGRCVSYGTAIPYLLMLDLLRSNCGILETDTPESMITKVRSGLERIGIDSDQNSLVLLHLLGVKDAETAPALANPEAVKAKTFDIFHQVAIKLSLERPLVLVLEDLHWVDKISEEFLGFLAENIGDARILMLATYRPGYRPPWIDKSYAGQVPVQPLSRDDSMDVVRSVLDVERIIELATEEIVAKADGNPLFLEQLTLHAGEAKDLRSGLMVPDTIHDVVMARIDRLPDELKQLLQMASVLGREFSLRLISAVWSGAERLDWLLRELNRLEFVYERLVGDGIVYVFRHALTQEAAYGSLLERHRTVHHGTVGCALEQLYHDRSDEVAELLALHFGRSNEAEKAVDYAIAAAEKSQRRCAYSEALSYFDGALRRLDAMPEAKPNRLRRLDAVIKQAELKLALGRHAEHIGALDDIRAIVEETDDPARLVAWHYWRGFLHSLTGGRPAVAIEHCLRAAEIASATGFDELDGFVASCLAQAYIVAGELRAGLEAAQRAVSIFETRNDLWPACRALWHLSSAANYLGDWGQSFDACRRALDYSIALKDPLLQTAGLWRAAHAHLQQGEIERGLQYCDEALALQPIPYHSAAARAVHGYGLIKTGRVEAGIAELDVVVAWFESSRLAYFWSIATLWLAEGHLARRETTGSRRLIERVIETTRTIGYLHFEGLAHRLMGECLAVEEPLAAEEHAENALRILERCGAQNDFAKALVTRAELRRLNGDFATARELLQKAKKIFVTLGTLVEPARVDTALADLDRQSRS